MKTYHSRLDFLMDATGTTGRELAAAIHIDPSLVSKWRNNHRSLAGRSSHLLEVAEYFTSLDGTTSLEEILEVYEPQVDWDNRKELLTWLCQWLTDPRPLPVTPLGHLAGYSRYSRNASYTTYMGNKGRREAVLRFLDYVLTLPEGQQLYLMSQEDMAWLVEDRIFLAEWQDKLIEVLEKHHKIKIIHWVDRSVDSLNSVISHWLPLHLTGGIESWFYPKYSDPLFQTTLFILGDDLAINGMSSPNLKDHRYTAMFHDSATVKHCQWVFSTYLGNCRPLIQVCSKMEMLDILSKSIETVYTEETAYLIWESPSLLTMSEDFITHILARHSVNDQLIHACQAYRRQMDTGKHPRTSRLLCNFDNLQHALQDAPILCEELTAITGHPIWLSREDIDRYISGLVESLQSNTGLEIAFFSAPTKAPINLFLRGPDLVLAWSGKLPYAAAVSEPTVVKAFSRYYDEFWQSVPRVNRDRAWVTSELLRLLAL